MSVDEIQVVCLYKGQYIHIYAVWMSFHWRLYSIRRHTAHKNHVCPRKSGACRTTHSYSIDNHLLLYYSRPVACLNQQERPGALYIKKRKREKEARRCAMLESKRHQLKSKINSPRYTCWQYGIRIYNASRARASVSLASWWRRQPTPARVRVLACVQHE